MLLLLTACAVVAASLVMAHLHAVGRSVAHPVDAAIVLGSGVDPDIILNYSTRRRVAAGVALWRAGMADRLIVSGGIVRDGPGTAAALMRNYALSLGMPAESVLLEAKSETTFENIRFSFATARTAGFARLALVTDDYHLLRASWLACYFGKCAVDLVAVPVIDRSPWPDTVQYVGRETLAWWYNLGKVALWSVPRSRRSRNAAHAHCALRPLADRIQLIDLMLVIAHDLFVENSRGRMSRILIVCEDACLLHSQAGRLDDAGHQVDLAPDVFRARDRLSGEPCDVVVIDVRSPDGGMGLLIEQARAAWPGCAVLALVERGDMTRSKVHEMGLWTPDATLIHPVVGETLVSAVAALSGSAFTRAEGAVN